MKDVATVHVAAVLDPEVKNMRLQAWGHSAHWNDILTILRRLRPQRDFVADYPHPQHLEVSVDQSESLALLGKWSSGGGSGNDGWTPLEESVLENVVNPYLEG